MISLQVRTLSKLLTNSLYFVHSNATLHLLCLGSMHTLRVNLAIELVTIVTLKF